MSSTIGTRPCSEAEIPEVEVWDWQEEGLQLAGREQAEEEHQEVERFNWDVDEKDVLSNVGVRGETYDSLKSQSGARWSFGSLTIEDDQRTSMLGEGLFSLPAGFWDGANLWGIHLHPPRDQRLTAPVPYLLMLNEDLFVLVTKDLWTEPIRAL